MGQLALQRVGPTDHNGNGRAFRCCFSTENISFARTFIRIRHGFFYFREKRRKGSRGFGRGEPTITAVRKGDGRGQSFWAAPHRVRRRFSHGPPNPAGDTASSRRRLFTRRDGLSLTLRANPRPAHRRRPFISAMTRATFSLWRRRRRQPDQKFIVPPKSVACAPITTHYSERVRSTVSPV